MVASGDEGRWQPAPGYEWVDGNDNDDMAVKKKAAIQRKPQRPDISIPREWGQQEKTILAAAVMMAAVSDRGEIVSQQDQMLTAVIALAAMVSPRSSPQDIMTFKMNLLQFLQQAGPYPDISQVRDMDSERVAITREMVMCIVNDCADLEQRLRRITTILENRGSPTLRTGNLGKIWEKLLDGTLDISPIDRAPPKYA